MNKSLAISAVGWLASALLLCAAATVSLTAHAHDLNDIASKMSSKGAVPIGGKFVLMDVSGKVVTDNTFTGKWQLIFFGFTTCPDVCSTVLTEVAVAMSDLGPDVGKIQPIFITMDPERDSAQRISAYLNSFDSRIVGLRGTDVQTQAAVRAFHVYSKKRETNGAYTMDHSAVLYLMKPDGSFGKLLSGDIAGHKLGAELRATLIQGHAS